MDIDENNKVSINYKNGSSEVYTINNADKLVLKSGIYKYENGCKIKRYARDGKTLLEESIEKKLLDIGLGDFFLHMTPKTTKEKSTIAATSN